MVIDKEEESCPAFVSCEPATITAVRRVESTQNQKEPAKRGS